LKDPALTDLAADWRKLLFPEANDEQFADGYAQAVTFGLLMARSNDIKLADGLDQVGKQVGKTNSLIGAALRLLTDEVGNDRVLDAAESACDQQVSYAVRGPTSEQLRRLRWGPQISDPFCKPASGFDE